MNKEILRDILEKKHASTFGWALYCWICDGEEAAEVLRSNYVHILEKDHRSKKCREFLFQPAPEGQGFEGRINVSEERTEILELLGKCCL